MARRTRDGGGDVVSCVFLGGRGDRTLSGPLPRLATPANISMPYNACLGARRLVLECCDSCGKVRARSLRAAAADLEVAPSHLSRLERGERSPSQDLTHRMAAYYGVAQEVVGLADGRVPDDVIAILQAGARSFSMRSGRYTLRLRRQILPMANRERRPGLLGSNPRRL